MQLPCTPSSKVTRGPLVQKVQVGYLGVRATKEAPEAAAAPVLRLRVLPYPGEHDAQRRDNVRSKNEDWEPFCSVWGRGFWNQSTK